MNFWNKFCGLVLFLLFFGLCAHAQTSPLSATVVTFLPKNKLTASYFQVPYARQLPENYNSQAVKQVIPANFYTCNIGFFCKKELLIEKATKIPLRFRLGSLQQCNYYEGKKQ